MSPDEAQLATPSLAAPPRAADGGPDALPSLGRRIALTFVDPRRLFAGFDERAPWIGVLVLSTLVAMLAAATQPAEFFLAQMENPADRLGRAVEVTSGPEEIVRWGRYLAVFSAIAGHPLVLLGVAGVLTVAFTLVGGGRGTFRAYLAVAAHALLVAALGTLLAVALRAATGDAALEPTLGRLVAPLSPRAGAGGFLAGVNLFTLWTLGVLGAGVAALDGRRSWGAAAAILVGGYLALVAAATLLAG